MNAHDKRRLLGPIHAKPIQFEPQVIHKQEQKLQTNHSLFIKTGLVTNANGSSYLEMCETEHTSSVLLLTSIYGPRPIRGSFVSKASLSIQFKEITLERWTTGEIQEICNFLTSIFTAAINLERYPKSGIDIFLNLVQYLDGNDEKDITMIILACINGITLALVNAGIEILDIVSAGRYNKTVAAFVKNGNEIIGLWKDDESDILYTIDQCKQQYQKDKNSLINYLTTCEL